MLSLRRILGMRTLEPGEREQQRLDPLISSVHVKQAGKWSPLVDTNTKAGRI